MAEQTVRVGFIGAGRWSQSVILPNLARMRGVQLVAVANSSEESTARVARAFGFRRAAHDWHEVVAAADIDAIVVGAGTDLHADLISPILDAGKHVLTMNALARTAAEAREMVRTADRHPRQVALVYPAVTGPFYLNEDAVMRHLLDSGYVGEVRHAATYWQTPFFGLGSMFEPAFRWFGPHARVLGYRKQFPAQGAATGGGRPQVNMALAESTSGVAITYVHSTLATEVATSRFEVYGSEGMLTCYSSTIGQGFEGFFGAKRGSKQPEAIPIPAALRREYEAGVPVEAEFIAAVRGERPAAAALPRFRDGVQLLDFTEGWRASVDSGAWRDLPRV